MARPGKGKKFNSILKASNEQATLRTFGIRNISKEEANKLFNKIFEESKKTGQPISLVAKEYAKKYAKK